MNGEITVYEIIGGGGGRGFDFAICIKHTYF